MKFLLLLLLASPVKAATVVLIDTAPNALHKDFKGQDIITFDYDGADLPSSHEHHGTGMLSLVINGVGGKDKLKKKHKYYVCSAFLTGNLKCYYLALAVKADVINYSGGGEAKVSGEEEYIKKLSKAGVKMFFAAGNEGKNLDKTPYYPAQYAKTVSGVVAVENVHDDGKRHESSNYASWTKKVGGVRVFSASKDHKYMFFTGTSPATAIATHEYLKSLEK